MSTATMERPHGKTKARREALSKHVSSEGQDVLALVANLAGPEPIQQRIFVTPEMAATLLEHNTMNRTINDDDVGTYVNIILSGAWDNCHPHGIALASDGTVVDGQHRLWAIVMANVGILLLIQFNSRKESIYNIDSGRPRSGSDTLTVAGKVEGVHYKYRALLTATTRLYLQRQAEGLKKMLSPGKRYCVENARTLATVTTVPEIVKSVYFIGGLPYVKGIHKAGCAFLHILLAPKYAEKVDEFMNGLFLGANLADNSPVLTLRNKLIALTGQKGAINGHAFDKFVIAITIKAWNAFKAGRTAQVLSWGEKEDVPAIK